MSQWKSINISRLTMTNFKRFYGTHHIDLLTQPESNKPLVLIGGDNGRGKTSIHEAINYVFYEDGDLPGIQTRPNYFRAVSDRLNRRALDEGQTDYGVAVELIAFRGDVRTHLHIERQWKVEVGERKVEKAPILIVKENGRPVDWLEDNPIAYQDFLRNVLPPRIAQFFFFDGERIQQLADEEGHDDYLIEAIEDILHITTYKTLRSDLKKDVIDYFEKDAKTNEPDDFFKLQEDAERIENDLEQKRERRADIEREIEETTKNQRRTEDELRRIAGPYAPQREELILEKQRIEKEIGDAKDDTQKAFESLPILLTGKLWVDLKQTLLEEQGTITSPERIAGLKKQIDTIETGVFVAPQPPPPLDVTLNEKQTAFYRDLFRSVSEDVFGLGPSETREYLHDLSEGDRRYILTRLKDVALKSELLRDAVNRRERLTNELRDVENKLLSTSDDPHVLELIQQNRTISEQIGRLKEEDDILNGEIQRLVADLAKRRKQIEDRQELRKATSESNSAIKLARKAQRALDDFIRKLAPEKLSILKKNFEDMYKKLRKPEDPVHSVNIDPYTWKVILLDDKDRPLERRVFSAGMREMYALALLWALGRASGRELPIVIDTPVARLDTTNRRSLFEKYLPYAGHQVIVLSTDTEVDMEWAKRLSPYVAKQYHLDYDPKTDSSLIRPGYFF